MAPSIRILLRHTAVAATLGATLLVPAAADAAEAKKGGKAKPVPVVTAVKPMQLTIGDTLEVRGRNFVRGRGKNTVVFQRTGAKAVFVKADLGTAKLIKVRVPEKLAAKLVVKGGVPTPTRFKLRVLAGRLGRSFTKASLSPVIRPLPAAAAGVSVPRPTAAAAGETLPPPAVDGDCDGDGVKNGVDPDDDNDLLSDATEDALNRQAAAGAKLDVCKADTDGDGVEDGYEYRSALDLNDDEHRDPNTSLPYPGKRPYPNPLDGADRNTDFDGDSLTLAEEQALWRYTIRKGAARTLDPLTYSEGEQYSVFTRGADGRRRPSLAAAGYAKHQEFLGWAVRAGYRTVMLADGAPWWNHEVVRRPYGLFDFNRRDGETLDPYQASDGNPSDSRGVYLRSEQHYFDFDVDGYLSDNERDEDGDGLTNYDESHGRMTPEFWAGCYSLERAYGVAYGGTDLADEDTDGDGVLDGADDQDHDDIPNVMELSRNAASGWVDWKGATTCTPNDVLVEKDDEDVDTDPQIQGEHHPDDYGRVNPFNPCLPATFSRTCPRHPGLSTAGAPFDGSPNWYSLN